MSDSNLIISSRYQSFLSGDELVRLGVAVALIDEQSRLLLELRSDVDWWGITGGRIEVGETPVACALREINEETGLILDPQEITLFDVYGDPKHGRILQYPERRVHLIDIVYFAHIHSSAQLRLSEESRCFSFFSAATLPGYLVPPAIQPIRDLIHRGLLI